LNWRGKNLFNLPYIIQFTTYKIFPVFIFEILITFRDVPVCMLIQAIETPVYMKVYILCDNKNGI